MKCYGCLKVCKDSSGIKCTSSLCEKTFCPLCINLSGVPTDRKKSWKCPDCCALMKRAGDNNETPVRLASSSDNVTQRRKQDSSSSTEVSEVKELTNEVRLLTSEIGCLKQRLEEATDSLTRCHKRLDEIVITLESQESRIKDMETKAQEVQILQSTVTQLRSDLNLQAQAHLRNEIEISGIPEGPNENLYHTITLASRLVGVGLEDSDIDWITRVGMRSPNKQDNLSDFKPSRPVVVRLLRRAKRDQLLRATRTRRNLTSADLEFPGPSARIFYNERLTKENRLLFREARSRAKSHGYSFCWCNRGSVFVRQREGKAAVQIKGFDDLDILFNPEVQQRPSPERK